MDPINVLKAIEERDAVPSPNDIEAQAYRRGYLRATLTYKAEIARLTKAMEDITKAPDFGHAYCIACDAIKRWT